MQKHSLVNQISTLETTIECYRILLGEPRVDARLTEYHKRVLEATLATIKLFAEHEDAVREAIKVDREKAKA